MLFTIEQIKREVANDPFCKAGKPNKFNSVQGIEQQMINEGFGTKPCMIFFYTQRNLNAPGQVTSNEISFSIFKQKFDASGNPV